VCSLPTTGYLRVYPGCVPWCIPQGVYTRITLGEKRPLRRGVPVPLVGRRPEAPWLFFPVSLLGSSPRMLSLFLFYTLSQDMRRTGPSSRLYFPFHCWPVLVRPVNNCEINDRLEPFCALGRLLLSFPASLLADTFCSLFLHFLHKPALNQGVGLPLASPVSLLVGVDVAVRRCLELSKRLIYRG